MRLTDPRSVHVLLLYLLPVVVAWAGWGVGTATLIGLMWKSAVRRFTAVGS